MVVIEDAWMMVIKYGVGIMVHLRVIIIQQQLFICKMYVYIPIAMDVFLWKVAIMELIMVIIVHTSVIAVVLNVAKDSIDVI
tara:strand:+ start:118 stop:363 length:246 start_codon:yes stop_codon:yes gene_type:complete